MERSKHFPEIYVMSKFTNLSTELKEHLPKAVNIVVVHDPSIDLNTAEIVEVPENILRVLKKAEVLITDTTCLAYLLYRLPNVKWVQITRAGAEQIYNELDPAKPLPKFTLTRYVDSNLGELMANYVLAQIINNERQLFDYHDNQKTKRWTRPTNYSNVRTLSELTVGILGAGTIGSAVGELLKKCGCKDVKVLVRSKREGASKSYDQAVTDIQVILKESNYICNSLPSTKDTKGFLDNEVFKNCEKKPVFINIGRGDVIKHTSIIKALGKGWISKAILDVFESEPLPPEDPLWNKPEVHITPHISALPKHENIAKVVAANYLRYVNGESLLNLFDWKSGY